MLLVSINVKNIQYEVAPGDLDEGERTKF